MLKTVLAAAALAGVVGLTAAPALADPSVCYDVYASVQVQDQSQTVAQSGCLPG